MAKVTDTARTLTLIASSASGDAAAAPGVADRQREAKVNYLQIYLAKATRRTAEAATPTPTCRNSQPTALLHHVRQTAQTDREGEGRERRESRSEGQTGTNNGCCCLSQDVLVTCPSRNETETGRNWQIAAEAEKKCEIEDEQGRATKGGERQGSRK